MTTTAKTDNYNLAAKLHLRREMLTRHKPEVPVVLDACQGRQVIWKALRREFDVQYFGIDLKRRKGRLMMDSARLLRDTAHRFNIVDIDTYGKPWRHYWNLLESMGHECLVFLTIGAVAMRGGLHITQQERRILGLGKIKPPPSINAKLQDYFVQRYIAHAFSVGVTVVDAAEAFPRGLRARYIGLYLRKDVR